MSPRSNAVEPLLVITMLSEAETSRHKKKYKQVLYSATPFEHSKDSIKDCMEIPWIHFVIFSGESRDSKYERQGYSLDIEE